MSKYGLYTTTMVKEIYGNEKKNFKGDLKVLEEHGFIETVSHGISVKQKNIYRFSDKWKKWPYE